MKLNMGDLYEGQKYLVLHKATGTKVQKFVGAYMGTGGSSGTDLVFDLRPKGGTTYMRPSTIEQIEYVCPECDEVGATTADSDDRFGGYQMLMCNANDDHMWEVGEEEASDDLR